MYERTAISIMKLFFGQILKNSRLWLIITAHVIAAAMQKMIILGNISTKAFVYPGPQLQIQGWMNFFIFLGIAVACWCADKLPKGKRLFTSGLFQSGMVLVCIAMWIVSSNGVPPGLTGIILAAMSFFIAGSSFALLLSAFEVIDQRVLGLTAGFAFTIAYILKVYVTFCLLKYLGWKSSLTILIPLGIFSAIGLLRRQSEQDKRS